MNELVTECNIKQCMKLQFIIILGGMLLKINSDLDRPLRQCSYRVIAIDESPSALGALARARRLQVSAEQQYLDVSRPLYWHGRWNVGEVRDTWRP